MPAMPPSTATAVPAARLSAFIAQILQPKTWGCGRIGGYGAWASQRRLLNDGARGIVAAAATSTRPNDSPLHGCWNNFLLATTGIVTLAVSPSGNEAAECAPPSRPNEQRQLGNVDAGGTEGMVDDVDGIFKAHLTVPPPMDRGDIPQDCNRSELLRRQVGFGSYGLSSSCPPSSAPSMQFAARPPHQLFLNAVGLAGSQSHGTGIMPPPHLSHLRQYEPDRASLYSSQLRLPQPFPQPPAPSNMTTMFSSDKSDAAHIRKAENCSLEESLDKTLYHEMNWTQDKFYIPCTHDPASDDLVLTDLCKFIPESPNPFITEAQEEKTTGESS